MPRALVIVNPAAAAGRASARLEPLLGTLRAHGLDAVPQATVAPGHAVALARAAAESGGFDLVVAAGGDGTAREVASGVLLSTAPATPVALLPVGTGNDLAHVAGTGTTAAACAAMVRGRTRAFDAIEVTCRRDGHEHRTHALCFAAVGLAADVVRLTTPTVKRWFGPKLCYSVGFFRALAGYRPFPAVATCDGREFRDAFLLICASNTSHAGGRMMHLSPGARPDDGQLNLGLIRATSRAEVAAQFFRLLRGTHVHHRKASYFPARDLTVTTPAPTALQLDGDCLGTTPARFRVLPGALRLVVGPD